MVEVREATAADGAALIALQARCLQGGATQIRLINAPDYFARARAYPTWVVFVATIGERVVGSASAGIRPATLGGRVQQVGYVFQEFVDPAHRGRRIATRFVEAIEAWMRARAVGLMYSLMAEGNQAALRMGARQGQDPQRRVVLAGTSIYREMPVEAGVRLRPLAEADLAEVAALLDRTWAGHELAEPMSPAHLRQRIDGTPGYAREHFLLLERGGRLRACAGVWDWSRVREVSVHRLPRRLRVLGAALRVASSLRAVPVVPRQGARLRQWLLTPVGFDHPDSLRPLLRAINNRARREGVDQMFLLAERDHPVLRALRGHFRVDTPFRVITRALTSAITLADGPLHLPGIDV